VYLHTQFNELQIEDKLDSDIGNNKECISGADLTPYKGLTVYYMSVDPSAKQEPYEQEWLEEILGTSLRFQRIPDQISCVDMAPDSCDSFDYMNMGWMGCTSVEEVRSDFADIRDVFLIHVKGPVKWSKLALFTETKLCETMNVLQGRLKAAYERKMRSPEESMIPLSRSWKRRNEISLGSQSGLPLALAVLRLCSSSLKKWQRLVATTSKSTWSLERTPR
jgi:hypothetical protein